MSIDEFINCIGWKLQVVDVDGVLWATDSYWIRPYEGSIVQRALKHWNLDGPGAYDVDHDPGELHPSDQPPTSVEIIRNVIERETPESLTLLKSGSWPVLVNAHKSDLCAVFVADDGSHVWLRRDYLHIVSGGIGWQVGKAFRSGPIEGKDDSMRQCRIGDGFVMPVMVS